MPSPTFSRRSFLAFSATLPWALSARDSGSIPVGLELYSVRNELKKDAEATVRAVAQMGYQGVEFYAPYFEWSENQTKQMRKLLDDLGIRCFSTHNDSSYLSKEKIGRARDMNLILGSKYVVMASSDPKPGLDGWKAVADSLNFAADQLESSGLKAGYHNHQREFTPVENQRPIEILARNTKPSVMLQLDVGTCLEAGSDPVAWIRANPRHRVRARLQAGAHVQLQHDGRLGIPGKDFDGALIFDGSKFALMIVIAGFQAGGFELIGGKIQRIRHGFPAVQTRFRVRRGHHYILAAENQVHVAGPADFFFTQVRTVIVCREAAYA